MDPAGGFWVVDAHESVRRYDAEGRFAGAVGGAGEGPGETGGYTAVLAAPERVLATGSPGRIQLFAPDGTLVASHPQRLEDGAFLTPEGSGDGRWFFRVVRPERGGRGTVTIKALDGDLSSLGTVGSFPGRLYAEHGPAGPYVLGNLSFAVDGTGRLLVGDTLRYRIELPDRVVERPLAPTPIPEDFEARVYDGVELALREGPLPEMPPRDEVDPEQLERVASAAIPDDPPPHLPFIEGILAAPDGSFWVERADRHPSPALRAVAHSFGYLRHVWRPEWRAARVFDLFEPDGAYRGTVEFAAGHAPLAVTGDRVYGVHHDEQGVERIVVHEVAADAN